MTTAYYSYNQRYQEKQSLHRWQYSVDQRYGQIDGRYLIANIKYKTKTQKKNNCQDRLYRQKNIYYNHINIDNQNKENSDSSDQQNLDKIDPNNQSQQQKKRKVQLCRNYLETRQCPYKQRCKFAHGLQQLLLNQQLSQTFRTKKCKTFYDKRQCRFGTRCNFKHDDKKLTDIYNSKKLTTNQFRQKLLTNYPEFILEFSNKSRINIILQQSNSMTI